MSELCILVRTAPYSKINAAEAVRHINGAVANNVKTSVVFVDDGVYCLKDNQEMGDSGFTSISAAVGGRLLNIRTKCSRYICTKAL